MEQEKRQKEILGLWNLIVEKFKKDFNVKEDRLRVKLDNKSIPQLSFERKRNRIKSGDFEIHFLDTGKVLSSREMDVSDILIDFIKIVGIHKVKNLGLKAVGNDMLISDHDDNTGRWKPLDEKYFVFVKTETPSKTDNIKRIISELEVKAKFKYL